MAALVIQRGRLLRALEETRVAARLAWPGCYVSVVTYGGTDKGALGFAMRVDADGPTEDTVRILYVGPTVSGPVQAIEHGRQDPLYQELLTKALRAKGTPS